MQTFPEIRTIILETTEQIQNSWNNREDAVRSVAEWCKLASKMFSPYLQALTENRFGSLKAMKTKLIAMLDKGIETFKDSTTKLQAASRSLNKARGKLAILIVDVDAANRQTSGDRDNLIHERRGAAYPAALLGALPALLWFGNPVGMAATAIGCLTVSFGVAVAVVEGHQIPSLLEQHGINVTVFIRMKEFLEEQENELENVKNTVAKDVSDISDLNVQVQVTKDALEGDDNVFGRNQIMKAVKDLIRQCTTYTSNRF